MFNKIAIFCSFMFLIITSSVNAECKSTIYDNDETKVSTDKNSVCVEVKGDRAKDMIRIEDVSIKKPLGGENSLPNKIIRDLGNIF